MNQPAVRHSCETLAKIDELLKKEEFTGWYTGELQQAADALADTVLHDSDLSDKDREALRNQRLGLLQALGTVPTQKQIHEGILIQNKFKIGSELPEPES